MAPITLRDYQRWSKKLWAQAYDACIILPDMEYGFHGEPWPEIRMLQSRFFQGLFWKNKYVIVMQLNKFFHIQEGDSFPQLLKALATTRLDDSLMKALTCTEQDMANMVKRCQGQVDAHHEQITRNRIVRNKTIAHSPRKSSVAGNTVDFEGLRELTSLAVALHCDMENTMFGRETDFTFPKELSLRHVVHQLLEAGVEEF